MNIAATTRPVATEDLLLRRQFTLGPAANPEFADPRHTRVGDGWVLTSHRDLEVTQASQAGRSVTLLGYALDPDHPEAGNQALVERLRSTPEALHGLINATASWGGRWAVIVDDGSNTLMWHDAAGLRPVCYSSPELDPQARGVTCASEAGLIARAQGFDMAADAVDFVRSRAGDDEDDDEVYWMPGDSTLYSQIRALLPNHCLDLRSGKVSRYWPDTAIPAQPYAGAVAQCVSLLRGQLAAACRRYPISISMTAGWDSRLMLALCQPVAHDLHAYTLVYPHLSRLARDVCVPARLLPRLGLAHHLYPYPATIDTDFKAVFRRNYSSASPAYCADTQALHENHPEGRICVTGDVAEIVKCHWRVPGKTDAELDAADLAGLLKLGHHPFLLQAVQRWLDGVGADQPLPLLDLFVWEQMAGRWQAQIRAEYDLVQDCFAPLNCRRLLVLMLGVPEAQRSAPDFTLFRDLIEALWPDTLGEPINPPERLPLSRKVLDALGRSGLTRLVPTALKLALKRRFA